MTTPKEKKILDKVIYSYTTNSNALEEENRILRETINKLKEEIEILQRPPLMICELKEIIHDKAIIRIPNGNEFLVTISSKAGNIKPGDSVLVEQKNLTIIRNIPTTKKFNVEKFVIMENQIYLGSKSVDCQSR
jgi:ATP-dependent 26S proteasome regulatory subunit